MRKQLIFSVLYLVVVSSCQASAPSTTTSATPAPSTASAPAPTGSPGAQRASVTYGAAKPTIRLFGPGAAPQRQLAYRVAPVARDVRLSLATPPPGLPNAEHKISLVLSWKTEQATEPRYLFQVTQAAMEVPGQPNETDERIRKAFAEVAGYATVPTSDQVTVGQTKGATTTPSVPMILHFLVVPLPAQAVGVGARWELSEPAVAPGGQGQATRTYELLSLAERGATVRVDRTSKWTKQRGAQKVTGSSRLTGQVEINFDDPLPQSVTATLVQSVSLPLGPDDDSPPIVTQTAVRLGPK